MATDIPQDLQGIGIVRELGIVGAGVTGLALGARLAAWAPVIFEKSRGVGGRLATRRTERGTFDHGAQFYTANPETADFHRAWAQAGASERWFAAEGKEHFAAAGGMTALAKALAAGLDIRKDARVTELAFVQGCWRVRTERGGEFRFKRVAVTAPLPQALELLQTVHVESPGAWKLPEALGEIAYAKAVVGLFEGQGGGRGAGGADGEAAPLAPYLEPRSEGIFSIADQKTKNVSASPAFTVTMDAAFSESHFDAPESETLTAIAAAVRRACPRLRLQPVDFKKWRYSHPLGANWPELFYESQNLVLCGDAFGGGSVNGALRSALAVARHWGRG